MATVTTSALIKFALCMLGAFIIGIEFGFILDSGFNGKGR